MLRPLLLGISISLCVGHEGAAQSVEAVLTGFETVALFDEAQVVSASPAGMIYVVDAGTSSISEFDATGVFLRELGGPGASEGQFDEPVDIDPTNGLILVVADAGNGRIQRFSREFLFLESLRLSEYDRTDVHAFPDQPRYRQDEDAGSLGTGRPIAVATTANNEMYAIDETQHYVVHWDEDRNVLQVIGSYDQGNGALVQPIALEVGSDGALFVLDSGLASILVYDAFGGYIRSMCVSLCEEARAIKRMGAKMAVVLPRHLLLYQERGLLEARVAIDLDEDVVDVLYSKGTFYVLTLTTLYRYTGEASKLMKLED